MGRMARSSGAFAVAYFHPLDVLAPRVSDMRSPEGDDAMEAFPLGNILVGAVVPTILVFLHAQWKAWVRHNAWRRHAKRGHHQSIR